MARVGLRDIHDRLLERFGPRGWWPLVPAEGGRPRYRPEMWREERTPGEIFEIGVGAILTQRVAWRNVAPVVQALAAAGLLAPASLLDLPVAELEQHIRPTGTYRRKAATLRAWCQWCLAERPTAHTPLAVLEQLAALPGFGPETVDSILLYGCGHPRFIADAYARRILGRVGLVAETPDYLRARTTIEAHCPRDRALCDEVHALLVELGKKHCRPTPLCEACPLEAICEFRIRSLRLASP